MTNVPPRVTWVLRSFLDYRVPVFATLDALLGHRLHVVFPDAHSPQRCRQKLAAALGDRAIEMTGEKRLGTSRPSRDFANRSWCLSYQPGLLAAIQATRPDVLIGDGFFQWSLPALLHSVLHRVPLVVCYERTHHTERDAQWYRTAYRRLAARCIGSVCCNGSLSRDYTQELGVPADRITTGFMVADSEQLARRVAAVTRNQRDELRSTLAVGRRCFLYVGQLIRRKGIFQLLSAWKMFEASHHDSATLVLVGDGPEREKCLKLIATFGLRQVRVVGAVDYDQIAPYYAAADVVVMPTLEDNWSLVVPEAMACGLPVLCSKYNGGWPELVHGGVNGWVFDPADRADLIGALAKTMQNEDRLSAMGHRSMEIAADFTPQTAAQAILSACHLALQRRGIQRARKGEPGLKLHLHSHLRRVHSGGSASIR